MDCPRPDPICLPTTPPCPCLRPSHVPQGVPNDCSVFSPRSSVVNQHRRYRTSIYDYLQQIHSTSHNVYHESITFKFLIYVIRPSISVLCFLLPSTHKHIFIFTQDSALLLLNQLRLRPSRFLARCCAADPGYRLAAHPHRGAVNHPDDVTSVLEGLRERKLNDIQL